MPYKFFSLAETQSPKIADLIKICAPNDIILRSPATLFGGSIRCIFIKRTLVSNLENFFFYWSIGEMSDRGKMGILRNS